MSVMDASVVIMRPLLVAVKQAHDELRRGNESAIVFARLGDFLMTAGDQALIAAEVFGGEVYKARNGAVYFGVPQSASEHLITALHEYGYTFIALEVQYPPVPDEEIDLIFSTKDGDYSASIEAMRQTVAQLAKKRSELERRICVR